MTINLLQRIFVNNFQRGLTHGLTLHRLFQGFYLCDKGSINKCDRIQKCRVLHKKISKSIKKSFAPLVNFLRLKTPNRLINRKSYSPAFREGT